ncbi:hypothetical protein [Massilia niabensis]|uniref:DNA polymerase Y-family little finger domain-containing protein n=1 Tax=Massilia niabensis TaxID=544910 RepID=A0ABW0L0G9_9BURK
MHRTGRCTAAKAADRVHAQLWSTDLGLAAIGAGSQRLYQPGSRAAEKLREQNRVAGNVLLFAHTSPFRARPQFSRQTTVKLTCLFRDAVLPRQHGYQAVLWWHDPPQDGLLALC